jgi:hypothetical protein
MIYVVDTCVFRNIFHNVYRSVVPEIWNALEYMLSSDEIVSVKEVYKELELTFSKDGDAISWIKKYKSKFTIATNEEALIVSKIYADRNFQNGVREKNIINGMPVADAFLVAKAKILSATVVTREIFRPHAASIPNICAAFKVGCIGEEEFQLMLKKYICPA